MMFKKLFNGAFTLLGAFVGYEAFVLLTKILYMQGFNVGNMSSMEKICMSALFALIFGLLIGKTIIDKYDNNTVVAAKTFDSEVYAIYYGSYNSLKEVDSNVKELDKYIYIEEGNIYYVYLAITKTRQNAIKFKDIYKDLKTKVSIVKINIDNSEFILNLEEYEKLLNETNDENSLIIIENQILACYLDTVVNND